MAKQVDPERKPREWLLVTSELYMRCYPETAKAYAFTMEDEREAREFADSTNAELVHVCEVLEDGDGD